MAVFLDHEYSTARHLPMSIGDILNDPSEGEKARVRGWIHRIRKTGKIIFAVIRNESGIIQVTFFRDEGIDREKFRLAKASLVESSVIVEGILARDERAPGGYEIRATDFEVGFHYSDGRKPAGWWAIDNVDIAGGSPSEICDGTDLGGNDCSTIGMGFLGGVLGCLPGCDSWDTSLCTNRPGCGNGVLDPGETCDPPSSCPSTFKT